MGADSASPVLVAGINATISKEREGMQGVKGRRGRGRQGRGGEKKGGEERIIGRGQESNGGERRKGEEEGKGVEGPPSISLNFL